MGSDVFCANVASNPQNTLATRNVFCVTGSDVSPPGGDTAPIAVIVPSRSSLPNVSTRPARS